MCPSYEQKTPKILFSFDIEIESGGPYFRIPIQAINGPFLWSKMLRISPRIFDIEIESAGLYFHIRLQPINGLFLWLKKLRNFFRISALKLKVVASIFTFQFSP